jgi:hypothetical protein
MTGGPLLVTLSGALVMAYAVIALFFLRFRRSTGDRLHTMFALAFGLLAVQRFLLSVAGEWRERSLWLYGLRLLAFALIILAIVDKNRGGRAFRPGVRDAFPDADDPPSTA